MFLSVFFFVSFFLVDFLVVLDVLLDFFVLLLLFLLCLISSRSSNHVLVNFLNLIDGDFERNTHRHGSGFQKFLILAPNPLSEEDVSDGDEEQQKDRVREDVDELAKNEQAEDDDHPRRSPGDGVALELSNLQLVREVAALLEHVEGVLEGGPRQHDEALVELVDRLHAGIDGRHDGFVRRRGRRKLGILE